MHRKSPGNRTLNLPTPRRLHLRESAQTRRTLGRASGPVNCSRIHCVAIAVGVYTSHCLLIALEENSHRVETVVSSDGTSIRGTNGGVGVHASSGYQLHTDSTSSCRRRRIRSRMSPTGRRRHGLPRLPAAMDRGAGVVRTPKTGTRGRSPTPAASRQRLKAAAAASASKVMPRPARSRAADGHALPGGGRRRARTEGHAIAAVAMKLDPRELAGVFGVILRAQDAVTCNSAIA